MSQPCDAGIFDTSGSRDQICYENSSIQLTAPRTKVYKYRWVILLLFVTTSVLNGFQWIQYSIISNVVQRYYSVESVYVDWLSIIFLLSILPFNFPALWLMNKKGLKVISVVGSTINCLASWIKVVSVRPDLFYVTIIGQAVGGVGQVYALNAPPRVAAVWFGQDQVSTACSIAVFGLQLGIALGFLLPPTIVKPHDDINEIGSDLSTMFYIMAGTCSVQLLLVILCMRFWFIPVLTSASVFRAEPELPPSPGQATRMTENSAFFDSLKRLSSNRGFLLLTIAYGLIIGVFNAFSTVLNQIVLDYYPGHEEDAGRIGLTLMIAGMFGSVVNGFVLDKTHKFKETALGLFVFSTVGMIAFTFTVQTNLGVVYGIAALLGFFMAAFLSVGLEFGAEITYPEPETTTAGIINTSVAVFSALIIFGTSALLNSVGSVWSNVALTVILLIGSIMTALIKQDLRRQKAHELAIQGSMAVPDQSQSIKAVNS